MPDKFQGKIFHPNSRNYEIAWTGATFQLSPLLQQTIYSTLCLYPFLFRTECGTTFSKIKSRSVPFLSLDPSVIMTGRFPPIIPKSLNKSKRDSGRQYGAAKMIFLMILPTLPSGIRELFPSRPTNPASSGKFNSKARFKSWPERWFLERRSGIHIQSVSFFRYCSVSGPIWQEHVHLSRSLL